MRYADYQELVLDRTIDAIAVCTPPDSHETIGLAVLRANKHLFMEKPLALSVQECQRLSDGARSAAVATMVGFHLRWHRLIGDARAWLASGEFGDLEVIRTVFSSGIGFRVDVPDWRRRRQSGGGVLVESGVHYYDLWRFFSGSEVQEVQATSRTMGEQDVAASVTAKLASGAMATASFCQHTADCLEIELFGSKGRLRIAAYARDGIQYDPSNAKGLRKLFWKLHGAPRRVASAMQGLLLGGYYADAYRAQWNGFLTAVRSGRSAGATFQDGAAATRIALAVTQSASSGRTVRIADCDAAITPIDSGDRIR